MLKFPDGDPRLGVTLSRRKVLGGLAASPAIPAPNHNWFDTLALQPFSRNPYSRNTQSG